jgi:hypothetical protein
MLICFGYLSTLYVLDIYQHRYVWIFISVDTIPIYFHEYIWTFISGNATLLSIFRNRVWIVFISIEDITLRGCYVKKLGSRSVFELEEKLTEEKLQFEI